MRDDSTAGDGGCLGGTDFAGYRPMRKNALAALILLGLASACSADKTPNAPEAGGLNLTATWSGPIVVADTQARMSWNLTQINSVVTGPATVLLSNGIVLLNGFLTGTLTGPTSVTDLIRAIAGQPGQEQGATSAARPRPA